MAFEKLAELIFPNIDKTPQYYIEKYPKRNLKDGAEVTRFAPSPTGYMHIGNFMMALIDYIIAKKVGECPNCEAEYYWNEQYVYKKSFDLTLI